MEKPAEQRTPCAAGTSTKMSGSGARGSEAAQQLSHAEGFLVEILIRDRLFVEAIRKREFLPTLASEDCMPLKVPVLFEADKYCPLPATTLQNSVPRTKNELIRL